MNVVDTDYLTVMRSDLVAVLGELEIPYHDYEPRSVGDVPSAWFGRPVISYDLFEKEVVVEWPMTFAGHPVDPESTTHTFDDLVWQLWRHLGLGRRVMADGQRSVTAMEARPATTTVGEHDFPTYDFKIRTTIHSGFC